MAARSTLLIVDDVPAIHTMLSALLREDSYELIHAFSGEEALAMAISEAPDLILLDIMMPDIDGFEVCRRLRATTEVADVPIIIVTALTDRQSRLTGLAAGADDFVSKPFDQAELRARVRTITRLDRFRRLLAERARFDRLVELAPDGVLIVDAAGVVRLANPAIVRLLAIDDDAAALGRRFSDFVAADARAAWELFFARVSQSIDDDVIELNLRRSDGGQLPVEVTAGAFEWDGAGVVQLLVRDVTRRKLAEEALHYRNLALHRLTARLADAQELERQNLARELHDRVGQNLTAINLNLNIIDQSLDEDSAAVRSRLNDSLQLLEEATRQVRTVMADLRPPMLDDYGLLAALQWYAEQFSARTGVRCLVQGAEPARRLPHRVEVALFRICQEALTNVSKHANATEVVIHLDVERERVRLSVADNGEGFVVTDLGEPAAKAHWGLLTMQERADAVNGTVVVKSQPGKGTLVTVEVKRGTE